MRKLLLAGLAGLVLAGPVTADERPGYRADRQEFREDKREFRDARREFQGERRELQGERQDYRRDARNDYRGDRYRDDGYRDGRRDWGRRDYHWGGARYRGPVYVHPRGYGYRPWNIGYRLPSAYYSDRYWIGDPGYYRLPPAYRGTRWVRVGTDALLISVYNGMIVQAVRGLYW